MKHQMAYEKVHEELVRQAGQRCKGTATFAIMKGDGDTVYWPDYACHAPVRDQKGDPNGYKGILTHVYSEDLLKGGVKGLNKEIIIAYLDWLLNESPFADAYLNKDPEFVYNKYVVCRTDIPSNYLLGALTATRYVLERPTTTLLLGKAKLRGESSESLSGLFHLSHMFSVSTGGEELSPSTYNSNHDVFERYCPIEQMKNFVKNKQINPNEIYDKAGKGLGLYKLWGSGFGGKDDRLIDSVPKVRKRIKTFGGFKNGHVYDIDNTSIVLCRMADHLLAGGDMADFKVVIKEAKPKDEPKLITERKIATGLRMKYMGEENPDFINGNIYELKGYDRAVKYFYTVFGRRKSYLAKDFIMENFVLAE